MSRQVRMSLVGLVLAVVGTSLTVTDHALAVVVTFPDANLEGKIRTRLGIPAPTPITDANMATMDWLFAYSSGISDLQGLEYASNLSYLLLNHNQISDISALSGLTKMTHLELQENQIGNISALAGLTNLTELRLYKNQIRNMSALSGMTKLTRLWLYNNQVSDISALSGLTQLNDVGLYNNQISDLSPLAGLPNLANLVLHDNCISDISALSGCTGLTGLILYHNYIRDVSPLAGLKDLSELQLGYNNIQAMQLRGMDLTALGAFGIEHNPLTEVVLADVTLGQQNFDALMDGGNDSYTGIAEWAGIRTLDMSGVDFSDIADLSRMHAMDDLETLLLAGATNLDGDGVVSLTVELDALDWLDVTGLWDTFDAAAQGSLNTWDAIEGNTLVTGVPEPATLVLLVMGTATSLVFFGRRR